MHKTLNLGRLFQSNDLFVKTSPRPYLATEVPYSGEDLDNNFYPVSTSHRTKSPLL